MREIAGLDMSIEAAEDYGSRTDNNFQTGDFVVVMARTWIGINKPGRQMFALFFSPSSTSKQVVLEKF